MKYKVQEIIKWWRQYNKDYLKIESKTQEFVLDLKIERLSHLLGLHYMYKTPNKMRGGMILKTIIKERMNDKEILSRIEKFNIKKLKSVLERINNFEYFIKNLEKGYIVSNSSINISGSKYFILEVKKTKFLQLGIGLDKENYFLNTFIVNENDKYFRGSEKERIISIEKTYKDRFLPFSFDEEKM